MEQTPAAVYYKRDRFYVYGLKDSILLSTSIVCYTFKTRHEDQWNNSKNPEIDPH